MSIDYRTEDLVDIIRQIEQNGLDFAFDGKDGESAISTLRRKGN